MRIHIKSFIIGVVVFSSYIFLAGQTYYNVYDVESIMKKLNDLDLIVEEINEIKAQLKHGVKVHGGDVDKVNYPVSVDSGTIDGVRNSIDCMCYKGK
tara:strand:+ start:1320 stop:1610 length:291 start_codon:yes stop_codon:yes gene_type:complete